MTNPLTVRAESSKKKTFEKGKWEKRNSSKEKNLREKGRRLLPDTIYHVRLAYEIGPGSRISGVKSTGAVR